VPTTTRSSTKRKSTKKRRSNNLIKAPTRGDLMIEFLQTLKVPDGPKAGLLLKLDEFQINVIKAIYDDEQHNDEFDMLLRVVRQAVMSVARKNGKTSLASGLVLGHLVGPEAHRWGNQCYSAAFEREQAALIYRSAASQVVMDEQLSGLLRTVDSGKKILCPSNNSFYHALSAESRSKHGLNPSFIIFDELAQFGANRELFDVLQTSQGAQAEPLLFVISTQAASDEAVLSQMIDYGKDVQAGKIIDPTFKLFLWETPIELDPWDEDNWSLANPALDSFRSRKEMRAFADRAKNMPSLEATFRNLYLNQRILLHSPFVSRSVWNACASQEVYELEDFQDRSCCVGLDLSARLDLTALVVAFEPTTEDPIWRVFALLYTPGDTIEDRGRRDRTPYREWVRTGHLRAPAGKSIDYRVVARDLIELLENHSVRAVAFDRWRIDVFKTALHDEGYFPEQVPWVPFGQGYRDMAPALDKMETLLLEKKLTHPNNPVLTWNAANAVVVKDPAGNRKLDKAKSTGRIDGMVALAMAISAEDKVEQGPDLNALIG